MNKNVLTIGFLIVGILALVSVYVWREDLHKAIFHGPSRHVESKPLTPEQTKRGNRPIYLTVRLRGDVRPTTLLYLSRVTEPDIVTAKSGSDLDSLLTEYYGPAKPDLRKLLRKLLVDANPGAFTRDKTPRLATDSVKFPAGPKVTGQTTVIPRFSGTLRELAQLTMGNNGDTTKTAVVDANPELKGQWDLQVSGTVTLPYTTTYLSYVMRTRSLSEARAVVDELNSVRDPRKRDPAVLSVEASYGFESVPYWTLASVPSPAISPSAVIPNLVTPPPKWPFQDLPDKLKDLEQSRLPSLALIAVVDTGIARGAEKMFPLWHNDLTNEGSLSDRCQNDVYGCNFLQPTRAPLDDCEIPAEYHHGTHIAGLVSGRLYAGKDELNSLIRLMILKAADENAELKPGNVDKALDYAVTNEARIVNLSLTGADSPAVDATISAEKKHVLFVAAAGNPSSGKGADLSDPNDTSPTGFPALLSKSYENVIGVASHNPGGQLSEFSNYGKDTIDLAAPGEGIPSLVDAKAEPKSFNGTSQATALVSLTAGILYSQGIVRPDHIKHRILASTDFKPDLKDKVVSEGVLNVSKALQFKVDLVQFKDLHVESGVLLPFRIPDVKYGEYSIPVELRKNLYKIVPHYSEKPGEEIRVTFLEGGKLVNGYTSSLVGKKIGFKKTGDTERYIPLEDILDIVPRQWSGAGSRDR